MSLAVKQSILTAEEYLEQERDAPEKNEYRAGKVFAMAGASPTHNLIVGNLIYLLKRELRGKDCRVYPSDLKVKVEATDLFTYPDVTVVCGENQYADVKEEVLANPTVIFEVLSPSTEEYDRGEKAEQYRTLESLQEYALVSQNSVHCEKYKREGRFWVLSEECQPDRFLSLDSLSCNLPFAEIYEDVKKLH